MNETDRTQSSEDAAYVRSLFDHGLNPQEEKPEDKKAAILAKVRAFLSRAADPASSPAEVEKAHAMANRLMTNYAIEAWMVESNDDPKAKMPELR
jgi:zona occludens toxin (predicted ATPase)